MHITVRTPKSLDSIKTRGDKQRHGKNEQSQRDRENSTNGLMDEFVSMNTGDDMNTSKDQPSVTYIVANATSALNQGQALGADALIVEPPEKGLEETVLQQLCQPCNPKQPYVDNVNML